MSASVDLVALSFLPFRSRPEIAAHLRAGLAPTEVLEAIVAGNPPDFCLTVRELRSRGEAALERTARADLTVVAWTDPSYPPMLAAIVDPPPLFWIRGSGSALEPPAVAIVGSRAGSPYALAVAERLAADLAAHGVVVVSGLARGVDSAAHRGALAAGATIAVLGSGADIVYPHEHKPLTCEIAASGAVVSELAPGTAPQQHFFPLRNRIISGLSRGAVVVIEAHEKSGSLDHGAVGARSGPRRPGGPGQRL